MSLRAGQVLVLALSLAACISHPPGGEALLQDFVGAPIESMHPRDAVDAALFVALGTVEEDSAVRPPVQAVRVPEMKVELRRTRFRIESVLRGDLPKQETVSFYYFSVPMGWEKSGRRPLKVKAGLRCVALLDREHGLLRTLTDRATSFGQEPLIPIYSGSPVRVFQQPAVPSSDDKLHVRQEVVRIMFDVGDKVDAPSFANALLYQRLLAQNLTGRREVRGYLQMALAFGGAIEAAACQELTKVYYGFADCWKRIADSNDRIEVERQRAKARWLEQSNTEVQTLKQLLRDPVDFGFAQHALEYSRQAILTEFEMLVDHPDPQVRRLTCAALHRYYPRSNSVKCAPGPAK